MQKDNIASVLYKWILCFTRRSRLVKHSAHGLPHTIGQKPKPTVRRETVRKSFHPEGMWHAKRDGRSPRNFKLARTLLYRTLPQSFATQNPAPSRMEPFVNPTDKKTPPKKNPRWCSLFLPLNMQRRK